MACNRSKLPALGGLLLWMLLSSCASTSGSPQRPAWIDAPPHQAGWYFGVAASPYDPDYGEAVARRQASKLAIAQLQQSIRTQVRSSSSLHQRVNDDQVDQFALTLTRLSSQTMELSGMSLEYYIDGAQLWALASLDGDAAVATLKRELNALELELSQFALPTDADLLSQLAALRPVQDELHRAEQLQQQLALLGQPQPDSDVQQRLLQQQHQLISALTFRWKAANTEAQPLRQALFEAITTGGARVGDADGQLTVIAAVTPKRRQQGTLYHTHFSAQITLKSIAGEIINAFDLQAKGSSSLDQHSADQKAYLGLEQQLRQRLGPQLLDTISGITPATAP